MTQSLGLSGNRFRIIMIIRKNSNGKSRQHLRHISNTNIDENSKEQSIGISRNQKYCNKDKKLPIIVSSVDWT